jgi:hypothetical protein
VLVPSGAVTVTSNVPAGKVGDDAVMVVDETTVNEIALVAPNVTAVAPVKPVPVIVTIAPPACAPVAGLTFVTVGPGVAKENRSAALAVLVPPGVVTATSTVPVAPAGDVVVIDVADTTVNGTAEAVPNLTAVAPVKFVPVIVTAVPPAVEPPVGDTAVTVGTPAYVNLSAALTALEPPPVVTMMSTVPVPAGEVAAIVVSLTTKNPFSMPPHVTAIAPVNPEPVIVTPVPPAGGPTFGLTPVTTGGAM